MNNFEDEHGAASAQLNCPEDNINLEDKEEIYTRALCRARMRMALYVHATLFTSVIFILVVINLLTTPRSLWVIWPFFGWGIALVLHWFFDAKLLKIYDKIKSEEIARELEARGE